MDPSVIDIEFGALAEALARPDYKPATSGSGRLTVAVPPQPFVAPKFHQPGSSLHLSVEVVFVQAPAVVGKTTMARQLSASRNVPLLNLAEVAVATGSLKALISDLTGPGSPLQAFHRGELPIIIDALDEGRLFSGETSFESFLSTTAELLLSDRTVTNRPKLVIFGRSDSTELAKLGLELEGSGDITDALLDIGWFGETEARTLIDEYAKSAAKPGSGYLRHPGPAAEAIAAYFRAIEDALGLEAGQLWTTERGQAFAGYAPVLAAVGFLLAEIDNLSLVATHLRAAGAQQAWGVIERVLQEILDREQTKLCTQLGPQASVPLPAETYDREEQLTHLAHYVHGQPLRGTGRVVLPPPDQTKYDSMVRQYLQEHPFVKHGDFRDPVLGAMVLAFAVAHDLLRGVDLGKLVDASRRPFLWRSLRGQLDEDSLIDGRYAGAVLSSFWSDPLTKHPQVVIRSPDGEAALIRIPSYCDREVLFNATLPLHLEGEAKDCDIDVPGTVRLQGHAPPRSVPVFHVHGTTTIICDTIEVAADTLTLHGQVWFEAEAVSASPRLTISPKNGTTVGWGEQLAKAYPWNQHRATLPPPYKVAHGDRLSHLMDECSQRFAGGRPPILYQDCTIPDDDPHTRWAARSFPEEFPALMRALVRKGLARMEQIPVSGTDPKFRVHLTKPWPQLRELLRGSSSEDQALVAYLRDAVP
jgi:hypothetical protein